MASIYASYPLTGGGGVPIYANIGAFPPGTTQGQLAVAADTGIIYEWNGSAWIPVAGPAGSVGSPNVIWQPGGTPGGNVYTTWADVYAAILPLGVAAIDVCCDNTHSSTFTITAGTYALGNTTIQAPVGEAPSNPVVVTIANGVTFTSFPVVSQLINLVSASSSTVFTVVTGVTYFIDVLRGAMLTSVSGAPMITVQTGAVLFIALEALTSMSGMVGFPVVTLAGTGALFVLIAEGAALQSNSIGGGASASIQYIIANPSASLDQTQTDFSGTSAITYQPMISNITVGNGLGDLPYALAAGNGTTLSANTTTSKLFLSETGTGSAGNAPVWSAISSGDLPNIPVTNTSTNASFFPTFVSSSSTGNYPLDVAAGLSFNPSTNKLTTTALNLSGLSASQAVVTDASKNLTSLSYTSTVSNSNLVSRDTNGNSGFNNTGITVTSTAATGQTITMTAGTTGRQRITGSGNITFNLPDSTTVFSGWSFYFNNLSSGTITLNRQDGTTLVATMAPGSIFFVACLDNGTVQGVWAATPWLTPTAVSNTSGTSVPGSLTAATQLISSVATGTAPLVVSSTTLVPNLYVARAVLADTVTTNATITLTGDVTGTGTGSFATTAAATQANIVTLSKSTGVAVHGTNTNDSAAAGYVGEFISGSGSGSSVPSSGTAANVASVSLTAGDWDVDGFIGIATGGASAFTLMASGISLNTGNFDSTSVGGFIQTLPPAAPGGVDIWFATGTRRISISGTTTVFLVGQLSYTTSGSATYKAASYLRARRFR